MSRGPRCRSLWCPDARVLMSRGPRQVPSRAMQEYYEELWQRLPDELDVPDFELRCEFLTGELRPGERGGGI